jgi:hypothetical protein
MSSHLVVDSVAGYGSLAPSAIEILGKVAPIGDSASDPLLGETLAVGNEATVLIP